jgi:hypothetical protein
MATAYIMQPRCTANWPSKERNKAWAGGSGRYDMHQVGKGPLPVMHTGWKIELSGRTGLSCTEHVCVSLGVWALSMGRGHAVYRPSPYPAVCRG